MWLKKCPSNHYHINNYCNCVPGNSFVYRHGQWQLNNNSVNQSISMLSKSGYPLIDWFYLLKIVLLSAVIIFAALTTAIRYVQSVPKKTYKMQINDINF